MIADALWHALRPYAISLLGDALARPLAEDDDAELAPHDLERVDAAVARLQQRSKQPARSGRMRGASRESGHRPRTTHRKQPGGES